MIKRLLCWLAAIMLCAGLYLFENNPGTLALLASVLVLPVCGSLPLAGKFPAVTLDMEPAREKGQAVQGQLRLRNTGVLAQPRVTVQLVCRNIRTGQKVLQSVTVSLLPRQSKTIPFSFVCPHSGKVVVSVESVSCGDLFGLFYRKHPSSISQSMTVLPQLFEPAIYLESRDMAMPDSDTYSPTKPGSDPGETFAIREYVPGDAIRQIHWKLSEKTDRMMVRQFGLPVVNEVALLLDSSGKNAPDVIDAVTEVFASISSALIHMDIHHRVFWQDGGSGELQEFDIGTAEDASFLLEQLLELPPRENGSIAESFLQLYPHCPYSHVIVVGSEIPYGIGNLYNGNRVSMVLCGKDTIPEGLQGDGTRVLSFGADSYAQDLSRMEV